MKWSVSHLRFGFFDADAVPLAVWSASSHAVVDARMLAYFGFHLHQLKWAFLFAFFQSIVLSDIFRVRFEEFLMFWLDRDCIVSAALHIYII
jgi:hypothetical protein